MLPQHLQSAGREAPPRCVWDTPGLLIHYPAETVVALLCPFRPFLISLPSFPFPSPSLPSFSSIPSSLFWVQRGALLDLFRLRLDTTSGFGIFGQYFAYVHQRNEGNACVLTGRSSQIYNIISMDRGDLNPRRFGDSSAYLAMLENGEGEYKLASEGKSSIAFLSCYSLTLL